MFCENLDLKPLPLKRLLMELKPQDIVVALLIGSQAEVQAVHSRRDVAHIAGISVGEVANCYKRLSRLQLIAPNDIAYVIRLRRSAPALDTPIPDPEKGDEPAAEERVLTDLLQKRPSHRLNTTNMLEFLSYGVRYYSQPDPAGYGRGMPTGWNCPRLGSAAGMIPRDVPLAWPSTSGTENGELITPIHSSAVRASEQVPLVYSLCALIDVLRVGRPREIGAGRDLIKSTMESIHDKQQTWLKKY
jgi:hypothetical protein